MIDTTELFSAFDRLNVLVVGDVMIDRYLTGNVTRISPEAPVPVVQLKQTDNRLGGAANVALNIRALGARPFLCSVVGDDENGKLFTGLLPEYQLSDEGIVSSTERMTTVKTRVIAQNQHLLRLDREVENDLSEKEAELLLTGIKRLLDQYVIHVILFQDYNKGVLSRPVIEAILAEARHRRIPTAVDPKNKNFWAYEGVDLFKPNLKEIQQQVNFLIKTELASLSKTADFIHGKLHNDKTLVTLSDKGVFLKSGSKQLLAPTQPRTIADVCGAGDTVISIAALCLALNVDMDDLALLANLAGGQVCEKLGVVPVDKQQLQQEFEHWRGQLQNL